MKDENANIIYSWTHKRVACGPGETAKIGTMVIENATLADIGDLLCEARNLVTGETLQRLFSIEKPGCKIDG